MEHNLKIERFFRQHPANFKIEISKSNSLQLHLQSNLEYGSIFEFYLLHQYVQFLFIQYLPNNIFV